ncbi:MAG: hypothetical protein M3Y80_10850 [Verrucomicrobiota bacterium]|nr:hypothetical protein [Verrucomicrobiota bacterium]
MQSADESVPAPPVAPAAPTPAVPPAPAAPAPEVSVLRRMRLKRSGQMHEDLTERPDKPHREDQY